MKKTEVEGVKRNVAVVLAVVVALGLIAWAGMANYRKRKADEARAKQPMIVLTPTATPSPSPAPPATFGAQYKACLNQCAHMSNKGTYEQDMNICMPMCNSWPMQ